MCVYKPEVRPGVAGIVDHLDVINDVRSKAELLLNLVTETPLSHDGKSSFTDNEVGVMAGMLRDWLEHAWTASDAIYEIYRNDIIQDKGGAR